MYREHIINAIREKLRSTYTATEADRIIACMYGACADPEEFFKITRSRYPLGPVTEFSEDDAMRFVEKVIVGKDRFRIVFKAGIEMEEMMGTANRPLPADR